MDIFSSVLVILFCSFYCGWACDNYSHSQDSDPFVATNTGSIIGTHAKVLDTDIAAFLGIPFAKPPTGHRRFQIPEPIDPWEGNLLANKISPPCMQNLKQKASFLSTNKPSEDCLYLNVWVPETDSCDNKLPVFVWIYGGAFVLGSTDVDLYDGSILAAYGNVIVVSMNYRVGSFGFLDFRTKDAPGNMGLHDQRLAMKWVKENIGYFGGDPEKITLFGESAGSISASIHMVSPLSRNLFNRAILQSGTAYHPYFMHPPTVSNLESRLFAKRANCTSLSGETDPSRLVACLQNMDAMTLVQVEAEILEKKFMYFAPTFGEEFLPVSSMEAYENGDIAPVDVLMGCNRDEGSLFLALFMPDLFPGDKTPNIVKSQVVPILRRFFQLLTEEGIHKIVDYYFHNLNEGDSRGIVKALSDSIGDYIFNCPTLYLAENLKNVHVYNLTHRSANDPSAEWLGVPHFSEVQFVFGKPIVDTQRYTPEDTQFSEDLIQKWVSFATNGYPVDGEQWKKFSIDNPIVYELNPRTNQQIEYPLREVCEFWREFIHDF